MELWDLTHPHRLWWLAAVLPLLWWLSRPVRPRRQVATAHMAQWLRARAGLRRRRVRFPWLRFLLAVAAAIALALAFCEPRRGARPGPRTLVAIVDTSASMTARADGGVASAYDDVRQRLLGQLAALPEGVDLRLLLAGAQPRVLVDLPADRAAARRAVEVALASPPEGAGSVDLAGMAARLAESGGAEIAVWTLTDGLGPTPAPRGGALTIVGAPADNLAIVRCAVRDAWPLPNVVARVAVFNSGARGRTVRLSATGAVVAVEQVAEIPGRGTVEVELELERAGGGRLTVAFAAHEDALPLDDQVAVELPAPPAPDIAVLVDGDSPALEAAAHELARETGGRVVPFAEAEEAAFLLVEGGVLLDPAPGLRALTFGTRAAQGELGPDDVVADPRLVDWDRRDPLTAGLDLSELEVRACLRTDFLGSGVPVVRAEHGPLVVVDEGAEATAVHASFRLAESNFWLLPSFPQFVRRALARCYRERAAVEFSEDNLLDAAESDLAAAAERPQDRPLPEFGAAGRSWTVPLLVLALAAIAARVWT